MKHLRTALIALTLVAVAAFLLFGPRADAHHPKGRVVVSYWEKWTGAEAEQMKEIVTDFNNTVGREKGIYVDYLSMSDVNRKTLVATAAGVPPDVAGLWDTQVAQFAAIDALEPLDEMATAHGIGPGYYKPVYWNACRYEGQLWALISTPAAVALHYNKKIFAENGDKLRRAGLDPYRAPQTLDELDRYAEILDTRDSSNRIDRAGYLPMEPGWFLVYTGYWFGGRLFDPETGKFTLESPENLKAFEWIRSYSLRMGKSSMTEFRSGIGNFSSAQNAFMTRKVVMEQQGPWMANYIENFRPEMNHVLGLSKAQELKLPIEKRRQNYEWGAAPFPSAVPGLKGVTYTGFDVLVIPRGAQHKKEAFEFIAYVNRQKPMEKLCSLHCKNSPLSAVSPEFIRTHPNPYIDVFDDLASSPNAQAVPSVPIWPEVNDEINNAAQRVYLLEMEPKPALHEAQVRVQEKYDRFVALQHARAGGREGTRVGAAQ